MADALAFSPDGRTLASSNDDTTALLWDVARSRHTIERPVVKLDLSTLDRLWIDVAGDNAVRAYAAMRRLAGSPQQAVSLVRERLDEGLEEEQKGLQQWLAKLDSDRFKERDRATRELLRMGRRAETPLRKTVSRMLVVPHQAAWPEHPYRAARPDRDRFSRVGATAFSPGLPVCRCPGACGRPPGSAAKAILSSNAASTASRTADGCSPSRATTSSAVPSPGGIPLARNAAR